MSVGSYLDELASNLIIRDNEKDSIIKSYRTLELRLKKYFGSEINFIMKFGSYHRNTILPRRLDFNSDVDVMIKFSDKLYKPQTYLNKLRSFAECWYSSSEIYQSNPTIVLGLNHIKFELVPCIDAEWYEDGNYKIPSKASDYQEWILTSPFDFNDKLVSKNKIYGYQIKPLIRIMKRWNVNTRFIKIYESFSLEQEIVDYGFSYYNFSLKDYFYDFVCNMNLYKIPQYKQGEVKRFIEKVTEIKSCEVQYPVWAETELRKFFD
ncbi:SMODS domain-containing nucleotidyltransferase [Pasteurella sp. PK-2025]|uniref:SMODS domain-containing nucleotidyltransferase n=1 Tax=Pasteurella sp. PK-2025 TaxID=3413133 RepID=UPI003C70E646